MTIYSAASLQDFVDCRRRYQLRYLLQVAWPAIQSEPVLESERLISQGARFHRLVQQHQLGIDAERLETLIHDEDLRRWWSNYLTFAPQLASPGSRFPEIALSAPLSDARIIAQYDLIKVKQNGCLVIYDWKTSRRRPKRTWLQHRLQTRLYPALCVLAGGFLAGRDQLQPDQIEMIYWFADYPDQPERFLNDPAQFEQDLDYLIGLVREIPTLGLDNFPLTTQIDKCRYCVYRSLCERGIRAGSTEELKDTLEEVLPQNIDFEQIAEIEF